MYLKKKDSSYKSKNLRLKNQFGAAGGLEDEVDAQIALNPGLIPYSDQVDIVVVEGSDSSETVRRKDNSELMGNVTKLVACESELFKVTLEVHPSAPVLKVNFAGQVLNQERTFDAVINYMTYHLGNPAGPITKPLTGVNLRLSGVSDWDADLIHGDGSVDYVLDIAFAAQHLQLWKLKELAHAKIASIIKSAVNERNDGIRAQAQRIRDIFGIRDKFPKEEPAREEAMKLAEEDFKPQTPANLAALAATAPAEVPIVLNPANYLADARLAGLDEEQLNVAAAMNAAKPAAMGRRNAAASPGAAVQGPGAAVAPYDPANPPGRK
jgi:hypothetical protein